MSRTQAATERWGELYDVMSNDNPGGLLGSVIARDQPNVLRLCVAYALVDGSDFIGLPHLEAAWAAWCYCRHSAELIFGNRLGDPEADRLLAAIRASGYAGLDGTAQNAVLGRRASAEQVRIRLERRGLIETVYIDTGGRPRAVSRAREHVESV